MPSGYEKSPDYGGKPPVSPFRKWALILYIGVLVILVRLYWPGWPFPNKPSSPVATQPPGTQVPQN